MCVFFFVVVVVVGGTRDESLDRLDCVAFAGDRIHTSVGQKVAEYCHVNRVQHRLRLV